MRSGFFHALIATALVLLAPATTLAANDIFYFKDSGGGGGLGIWNNGWWFAGEICPGDGGEYMDTLAPGPAGCAFAPIPPAEPVLGAHTLMSLTGNYPAGTWRAVLYLKGTRIPAGTMVTVRLFRENNPAPNLCTNLVQVGTGTTAVSGTLACARTVVNIPVAALNLANQRLVAVISKSPAASAVTVCWNCAASPSRVEATGDVAAFAGGGRGGPAESPGAFEESTWGSIKSVYR
jgi:hypothetical protein